MDTIKGRKSNGRKFHGGGARPDHSDFKCEEAKEREAAWRKLSPTQQLTDLDKRLGNGVGAVKQRARLQLKLGKVQVQEQVQQKTISLTDVVEEKKLKKPKRDKPARAG